jgi:hypothetical protein
LPQAGAYLVDNFAGISPFVVRGNGSEFLASRLADVKDYVPLGKPVQFNLYSIVMKDGAQCTSRYGWREYDFRRGLIHFFTPGQIH